MIETLVKMKHHIWTAYRESKTGSGCNDWGELRAGKGQGNGAGPAIWAAVSTLYSTSCKKMDSLQCWYAPYQNNSYCWQGLPLLMTQTSA